MSRRQRTDVHRPPRTLPDALSVAYYPNEWREYCLALAKKLNLQLVESENKTSRQASPDVTVFRPDLLDQYYASAPKQQ